MAGRSTTPTGATGTACCPTPTRRSTNSAGAGVADRAVQWTVARAVGLGLWKDSLPFRRTAKGGATRRGPDFAAFWEGILAALLLIGAVLVVLTNHKEIRELNIFAGVLVI